MRKIEDLTVKELRKIAKMVEVSGYSKMTKEPLITIAYNYLQELQDLYYDEVLEEIGEVLEVHDKYFEELTEDKLQNVVDFVVDDIKKVAEQNGYQIVENTKIEENLKLVKALVNENIEEEEKLKRLQEIEEKELSILDELILIEKEFEGMEELVINARGQIWIRTDKLKVGLFLPKSSTLYIDTETIFLSEKTNNIFASKKKESHIENKVKINKENRKIVMKVLRDLLGDELTDIKKRRKTK